MGKNRMEAFFDGVVAIIITIYVGIYWNNHHHMLHACHKATGTILWANLHLLFWLSLIPFTTGWMGENHFASLPAAAYGLVLLMAAIAYWILQQRIIASQGEGSVLRRAVGNDWKGRLSPVLYVVAILVAFLWPWVSVAIYVFAALMWVVPDRRIERVLTGPET
jgi:uncharacterized membrane protein